ncbi:MAG: HD domain-containing protein [Lachnospiraceae bacterium]|nr:HD domain-containing protein [Lachnospiraceae bacterium]
MKTYINNIMAGDYVHNQVFYCVNNTERVSKNGKKYNDVNLRDRTGELNCKIWDVNDPGIEDFSDGDYVEISGECSDYQNKKQLKISRARKVSPNSIDMSDFVLTSKYNMNDMYSELHKLIDTVKNEYFHTLLDNVFVKNQVLASKFKVHPAAKTVHHAFAGGLLEHTLTVAKNCDILQKNYPFVKRDLLLTAAIFHDIGKLEELGPCPNNDYTEDGNLMGHIFLGAEFVSRECDKIADFPREIKNDLVHCILAHHGKLEFGSPKVPMMVEAVLLNYADDLDAKMQQFEKLFDAYWGQNWISDGTQFAFGVSMIKKASNKLE